MSTATVTRYKPEDLLGMPDEGRYELIDGRLLERNMGTESSGVAQDLRTLLSIFVRRKKLGRVVGSDAGFQIFGRHKERVRYTDGAFISKARIPGGKLPRGHCRVAPEIAIEAVSPNDNAEEVVTKAREWIAAGVKLVWVLYPGVEEVHVYRMRGAASILSGVDELSGEAVLPGFKCRVSEIFQGI